RNASGDRHVSRLRRSVQDDDGQCDRHCVRRAGRRDRSDRDNGAAVPFTLSVPGQGANLTLAGTQSQTIRAILTRPSATCGWVQLFRADGTTFVGSTYGCGTTLTLP